MTISSIKISFLMAVLFIAALGSPLFASFDGDMNTDLFVVSDNAYHPTVHWFEYNRLTQEQQWQILIDNYSGEYYYAAAVGDIDGDNYPDLLVGSSERLYWFEAYSDNTATQVRSYALPSSCRDIYFCPVAPNTAYIVTGDYDDDPNTPTYGTVMSLVGEIGDNDAVLTTLVAHNDNVYRTVMTCDFDGDGKAELFVGFERGHERTGGIHLYEASPADGSLLWIKNIVTTHPGGDAFACGDFDGDGAIDVILSRGTTSTNSNGYILWYKADGTNDGLSYMGNISSRRGVALLLTDYDGDSNTDLLYTQYPDDSGSGAASGWHESTGPSQTPAWRGHVFSTSQYGHCLVAGDWNGDGVLDVILGGRNDGAGKTMGIHRFRSEADNESTWMGEISGSLYDAKDAVLVEPPSACGDLGTGYLPADLDQDCYVDIDDLAIFVSQWLYNSLQ
jgi:hypothetical protein